ncbi:VWA domain-containing protein, partial [Candidatus Poribacteria bacterium]|nr:VWA domain-containing protein [Candidatus Poribacteria bacterium]
MLRRRSARPALVCSLIIHLIIAAIMMHLQIEQRQLPWSDDGVQVDIAHFRRPEIVRPEPVEPPPPEPVEVAPEVSAPKPTSTTNWLTVDTLKTDQRTAIGSKVDSPRTRDSAGPVSQPQISAQARPDSKALTMTAVDLPREDSENGVPLAADQHINVAEGGSHLSESSPEIGVAKLRVGRRRGEALDGMPIGNSGGSIPSGTSTGNNYIKMMTELARNLTDAAVVQEVDLVFIIDKTGSMEDNVRGIRAYIDLFFEHFARSGHDAAFGLVTFADTMTKKPKVQGVTTDHGKFKNWLYKIKFEGGGDLAESGLDALMAALHKIKFRRNTQRFFVLASDGAFHDADYDGRSEYSQDGVIETLQQQGVRVDVIGLNFLPIKQLAWATGGTWRAIPGRGYLEHIPRTLTAKMLSELGVLGFNEHGLEADEIVIYLRSDARPVWIEITWKVLNPLGERCYGPFSERLNIPNDGSEVVRFTPTIDINKFRSAAGTYTIIFHILHNLGQR